MDILYSYIKEKGKITNREARTLLKVSGKTVNQDLTVMVNMGVIKKEGIGRGVFYTIQVDNQKKEASNGKEIGHKEGKGAGIDGKQERIFEIQKHADAFGEMGDLAKEMIEKGASVETVIKKFKGERSEELVTIVAKKWGDYCSAARGWADPILSNIAYQYKNYTEEEGLSQRVNNILEDSHIPHLKNLDKLRAEVTKAAQPILDLLFTPNERWVIPELPSCSSLDPARFKKWLSDGHKIVMDIWDRIENALNKVAFAEQKERKEDIGLELSYSLKTDSPKGKGMGIRDEIKRVRELFEKEELKEYLK